MMIPYNKLKSLPESEKYLKPGGSAFVMFDQVVMKMGGNQDAKTLYEVFEEITGISKNDLISYALMT